MRYALTLMVFASPALAHDGIHAHPHGIEGWSVGLVLLAVAVVGAVALKVRK